MISARQIIALALSLLLAPAIAYADDLVGKPRIVDGDTIEIGGTKIRLHGIDAPEDKQTCKKADGSDYRCGATRYRYSADLGSRANPADSVFEE